MLPGLLSLEGRDIGQRDIYKEERPGEDPIKRGCHKPRRPISGEFDPVTTLILQHVKRHMIIKPPSLAFLEWYL